MSETTEIELPAGAQGMHSNQNAQAEAAAQQREQQEQMKNAMLSQCLDQRAMARLNTVRVAKPERGQMVESILINMMRMGQIRGKITEEQFVDILGRVPTSHSTSVKFERRRQQESSDEEDFMKDL